MTIQPLRIVSVLSASFLLGVSTLVAAIPAKGPNENPEKGKETAVAAGIALLGQAGELVKYARDYESPAAMLAAVDMIRRVRLAADPAGLGTKVAEADTVVDNAESKGKTLAPSFDPKALLIEARAWAANDARLTEIIDMELARPIATASGTLGATGGRKGATSRVEARSTDTYEITFRGGELARIAVVGDGDTDLDLFVYDEDGYLIVKDDDDTDTCIVQWTPRWTGKFSIKIKNLGRVYNAYEIATN